MDATQIVIAAGATAVPVLSLLFYAMGQAKWHGKIETKLEAVEEDAGKVNEIELNVQDRIDKAIEKAVRESESRFVRRFDAHEATDREKFGELFAQQREAVAGIARIEGRLDAKRPD